ncbi:MAG: hypothetical protein R3B54_06475 [Bdellovibrionota bacterium]
MSYYWGKQKLFPALLCVLLLPSLGMSANPPSVQALASKKLDTMNSIELGRLAGIQSSVAIRVGKDLNKRLKEKYLQVIKEKFKDVPEELKELEAKIDAEDFVLDSKQLLETLEANPDFDVNLPEKMELMAALRLANREGREGQNKSPSANLRDLIVQELRDAIDNKVPSLRLSASVTDAIKGILPKLPEELRKKAESALTEEEVPVKVLKEIFDDKAAEAIEFDTLRDALAELRTDHSLAAGVRFADSFARDRRADLVFRNGEEKFKKVLDGLLDANKAAKEKSETDKEKPSAKNDLPDGFSKVPSESPTDEPFKGPHAPKNENRPVDNSAANNVAPSAGQGLFSPESAVRGFDIGSIDPGTRSSFIPRSKSGSGAANIAGAKPASGQSKSEAEAAIAELNAQGIFDFSIDIFSDYGDAIGKCQMTAIQKVFDAVARVCRMKFSTADHCVRKKANTMEIAQLGRSFGVVHAVSQSQVEFSTDEVVVQRPQGTASAMDIALVSLNLSGESCPSDTKIPTFELASYALPMAKPS